MPEFTLDQAVTDLHDTVERFKAYCSEQRKLNPEHWPETLSEGDWFEQFMVFATNGADTGE